MGERWGWRGRGEERRRGRGAEQQNLRPGAPHAPRGAPRAARQGREATARGGAPPDGLQTEQVVARPPRDGGASPGGAQREARDRFRRMFYALLDNASGRFGRIRGRIVRHLAAPIGRFSPACLGVKAGPPASGIWGHSMRLDAARANKKLYSILRGWEAEEEQREGVPIGSVGIPFQPAPNGRLQLGGARVTKTPLRHFGPGRRTCGAGAPSLALRARACSDGQAHRAIDKDRTGHSNQLLLL
ncbi:unnamed protein product, partial [Prorocentrum cordatum]